MMRSPASLTRLLGLVPLIVLSHLVLQTKGHCKLHWIWQGGWFQSGVRDIISITDSEFSTKGVCHESSGEKFVFQNKADDCYRCVVISEKHYNVLQYKETLCEPNGDLNKLCSQITGDALLFSMFRRDALPVACPFKGPLTFSYTRGHGMCASPASTIDSCTSDFRLLFKYQACPDVQGTESSVEEVECIGHWNEGSTRYFVGRLEGGRAVTDEDRYRCYAWQKERESENQLDYRMAQSGDATCNGVFSAYDGSKNLRIRKAGNYSGCVLPSWVTHHRRWHALDKGASYYVSHHNTTLKLHYARSTRVQPTSLEQNQFYDEDGDPSSKPYHVGAQERLVCSKQVEATSSRVMIVTHITTGCDIGYACTVFYKRDGHIIEMQQGNRAIRPEDACSPLYFNATQTPHTTLTSASPSKRPCPFIGVWVAGEGECGKDVTHLRAGCASLFNLHFVHACPTETTKHAYVCHGHWAEAGSVYVVASPDDRPSHRLCLIATSITNKDKATHHHNSTNLLQVTAHAHSCPRRHVPPTTTLSLNLTALGECAEPIVNAGQGSTSHPFLITALLLLLSCASLHDGKICR